MRTWLVVYFLSDPVKSISIFPLLLSSVTYNFTKTRIPLPVTSVGSQLNYHTFNNTSYHRTNNTFSIELFHSTAPR
jgi:hypothetical protein